jgi:hypothetical protein
VSCVAFSPDGGHLVSGSNDGTIRLWDAVRSRDCVLLKERGHNIGAAAMSPDGTKLGYASSMLGDIDFYFMVMMLPGRPEGLIRQVEALAAADLLPNPIQGETLNLLSEGLTAHTLAPWKK